MGIRDFFPELKRHGHEAEHSPLSNAKLRMHESIPPFPVCPHGMHRDNFFIFIFHYQNPEIIKIISDIFNVTEI